MSLYNALDQSNDLPKKDAIKILKCVIIMVLFFLCWANLLFNPKLMQLPMIIIAHHPVQNGKFFTEYCNDAAYYYTMCRFIQNQCENFDKEYT